MQTTRAAPPRPDRPPRATAPAAPPTPARAPISIRPPAPRDRVDRWGTLGSLAVHALAIVLVVVFRSELMPPVQAPSPPSASPGERVDYLELSEFPASIGGGEVASAELPPSAAAAAAPTDPRRVEESLGRFPSVAPSGIRTPAAGGAAGGAGAASGGATSGGARVGEALRPGYRDDRLYVDAGALRVEVEKSQHQQYMEHLTARIDAINDSVYGESERARKATDWTKTDKEGRRWGLSPEGLHLGALTVPSYLIPRPAATGDNASLEEARQERRAREEIQRQEDDRARRQAREEAIRRTRERKEAEKKPGTG